MVVLCKCCRCARDIAALGDRVTGAGLGDELEGRDVYVCTGGWVGLWCSVGMVYFVFLGFDVGVSEHVSVGRCGSLLGGGCEVEGGGARSGVRGGGAWVGVSGCCRRWVGGWRRDEGVEKTGRVRVAVPLRGAVSCLASDAGAASANAALLFNRPPRFCWRTVAHR